MTGGNGVRRGSGGGNRGARNGNRNQGNSSNAGSNASSGNFPATTNAGNTPAPPKPPKVKELSSEEIVKLAKESEKVGRESMMKLMDIYLKPEHRAVITAMLNGEMMVWVAIEDNSDNGSTHAVMANTIVTRRLLKRAGDIDMMGQVHRDRDAIWDVDSFRPHGMPAGLDESFSVNKIRSLSSLKEYARDKDCLITRSSNRFTNFGASSISETASLASEPQVMEEVVVPNAASQSTSNGG